MIFECRLYTHKEKIVVDGSIFGLYTFYLVSTRTLHIVKMCTSVIFVANLALPIVVKFNRFFVSTRLASVKFAIADRWIGWAGFIFLDTTFKTEKTKKKTKKQKNRLGFHNSKYVTPWVNMNKWRLGYLYMYLNIGCVPGHI